MKEEQRDSQEASMKAKRFQEKEDRNCKVTVATNQTSASFKKETDSSVP